MVFVTFGGLKVLFGKIEDATREASFQFHDLEKGRALSLVH
jgi:hypothetical protein